MSKQIKQMQMEALKQTFHGVRDLVFLSISGLNCQEDNQLRLALRKKDIRLHVVKNSLARRVFSELGLRVGGQWAGPTTLAWGGSSIAELSKELDAAAKKYPKIKPKLALADGLEVPFQVALTMPTKAEASGRILMLALSPAGRIAGMIQSPGGRIAGQIKALKDRAAEGAETPAAETPAAETPAATA